MPILGFLLSFPPSIAVVIFSVFIGIIINFFYKVLVNQNEVRQVKARVKEVQKQSSDARKAGDTKRSSELMSEAMKENSKMMRFTMKPMVVSMVIVIIFLPLLSELYVDSSTAVPVNGVGILTADGKTYALERTGEQLKINDVVCDMPCVQNLGDYNWKIAAEGDNIKFSRIIVTLPVPIPYFGDNFGWLGWYIISSIPIMIIIRKLMKIDM